MICVGCVGRRAVLGDVSVGVADKQPATDSSRLMQISSLSSVRCAVVELVMPTESDNLREKLRLLV